MPLDLSGFDIPEQKFEGLYKLADTIRENKLLAQKQAAAEAEAAKEAKKEEQTRITLGNAYLDDKFDKKKYATGNFGDDEFLNKELDDTYTKLQNQLITNKGMDVNQLRVLAKGSADNIWNQKTKLSEVNQFAERIKKENENKPGVDSEAIYNNVRNHYLRGADGNLKADFSDVKLDQNDLPAILMKGNVFNQQSFDKFVKESGKESRTLDITKKVGNRTVAEKIRTNAPNSFVPEQEGDQTIFVPKYEIATLGDAPVMHTIIKDGKPEEKAIRMVDEDVYNQFTPEMKGFIEQESQKYISQASQSGKTPDPTQIHQFQKALGYHLLENSSKLSNRAEKITSDKTNITINAPSENKLAKIQTKNDLFTALDTEQPDTEGNLDVTGYLPDVKAYGQIKAGQGVSVKLNPTKKQVTVIDADNVSHVMPFSKFVSTIQTANTKDDREFISMMGGYKGKGSTAAPTTPPTKKTTQAAALLTGKNLVKQPKLWEK